jgi:MFS transporter, DHA2 family, multidrug resistance protein
VHAREQALLALGRAAGTVHETALGMMFRELRQQASVLAYSDTFLACAVLAFASIPLVFLFGRSKGGGPAN